MRAMIDMAKFVGGLFLASCAIPAIWNIRTKTGELIVEDGGDRLVFLSLSVLGICLMYDVIEGWVKE